MPKVETRTDAAFKMSLTELEGVDELSTRVFRAFLNALRQHGRLMMRRWATSTCTPARRCACGSCRANDGVTQRDLADALHVARPTVTKMLNSMEKAGLVRRRPDAPTPGSPAWSSRRSGRAEEKKMQRRAADYVNSTIATLPEADRRELARLLEELGASISSGRIDRAPQAVGVIRLLRRGAASLLAADRPRARPACSCR